MRHAFLILAVELALGASPAFAEDPGAPNQEGEYGGVQPGQAKKAAEPNKKPKKPPPKGTLSWIGFETKEGGSEVFLQSIEPFQISQHVDNGTLVVDLTGVTKLAHNTGRPIDTRFFDTSLSRISAKKKGKGIEVRIAFKNAKDAAQAELRRAKEADGMFYAHLSFAGGGSTPAATETVKDPEK